MCACAFLNLCMCVCMHVGCYFVVVHVYMHANMNMYACCMTDALFACNTTCTYMTSAILLVKHSHYYDMQFTLSPIGIKYTC